MKFRILIMLAGLFGYIFTSQMRPLSGWFNYLGLPVISTDIIVPPGGDVQAAINAAQPGDSIVLQADADYTCTCILPNKAGSEYISIKSSRYGEIPIRDFYSKIPTAETAKLMARVKPNYSTEPTFAAAPGSHHFKLLGLDLKPPAGQGTRIVELGVSGTAQDTLEEMPHDFVIDKSWLHADTTQEMQRCLALNSSNTDVTNSWLTDCHGRGYDSQAIGGWNGGGNYHIINNSLSGAGENFMLGGSPATIPNLIPAGLEFRRNYVWKPLTWYVNDPSYAGIHWTVKNLFELKNARNVIVDGNVFDGNWTDGQAGRAIVFTPRPSDSGLWATIEDVTFENNIVLNVGSGLLVLGADEAGSDPLHPIPTDTRLRRIAIRNSLWLVDGPKFGSNGAFATIINKTEDVTLESNTAFQNGNIIISDYAPNIRFIYRRNISPHNDYGVIGSGRSIGNDSINYYFPGAVFTENVIAKEVNAPSNVESIYPAGNLFPATLAEVFSDLSKYQVATIYAGKGADYAAIIAAEGSAAPVPSPTPSPTVTSSPSPSPTPTPSPSPSPSSSPPGTPTACTMTVNSPILSQWSTGKLVVTFTDLFQPSTVRATQTSGQVTVSPSSQNVSPTSTITEFLLQAKKKSSNVILSGPCGSKTVMVTVR